MTTHQLANLLEHLQQGFGDSLKSGTGFAEAVAAMRELPEQSLKELAKTLSKPSRPQTSRSTSASRDIPAIIEQIRGVRDGTTPKSDLSDLESLTKGQLTEILRAFGQSLSGTKGVLASRIRQMCTLAEPETNSLPSATALSESELAMVESGVRAYTELRDNKILKISDVRAGFEQLRSYPKSVVEEISRRLKYTPFGSRTEMLDRLLSNLEGIKMSQYRMEQILTGT